MSTLSQRLNVPAGLPTLFFTEMWERFSYYGMRALLVLYLTESVGYPREHALQVYATYTGLVYITPIFGGFIADRWLGAQRAILVGAVVMGMGHFAMAFPSMLHLALGLIIIGNGFFKPNISTIVGGLYASGDTRRDGGYTLFYMGINLGAFIAPFVCSTLGEKFGWHYGFAAAGVGMIFALIIFLSGRQALGGVGRPPHAEDNGQTLLGWNDALLIGAYSLASLATVYLALALWPYLAPILPWIASVSALALIAMLVAIQRTSTRQEFNHVLAILIVAVFVIFFWMGFEQAGGTMSLFARDLTDRSLFGETIPAGFFQSINPMMILLLAPLFSMLWTRLDASRFALSAVVKQGIGMIILGLGFVVMAIAAEHADAVGKISPLWLVSAITLHTMGEICLSPIGLSMVSKLAPPRLASLMMGLWLGSIAVANYLAGTLEAMLADSGIPLYWFLVGSSVGSGLLLLLISPLLHRMMQGAR